MSSIGNTCKYNYKKKLFLSNYKNFSINVGIQIKQKKQIKRHKKIKYFSKKTQKNLI